MSAISELIDVKFVDNTNYVNTSGSDVAGCVFDYCWGPVGRMVTYNQKDFFSQYPEGMPYGWTVPDSKSFYSYAQIKKVFASAGSAGLVEAYRIKGNWKYLSFPVAVSDLKDSETEDIQKRFATYGEAYHSSQFPDETEVPEVSEGFMQIALVHPGFFPYVGAFSSYIDYKIRVDVSSADALTPVRVSLYGISSYKTGEEGSTDKVTLLESFSGSFDPTAVVDSQSFYIIDVINGQSQYMRVRMLQTDFYGVGVEPDTYLSVEQILNSKVELVGSGKEAVLVATPLITYENVYPTTTDVDEEQGTVIVKKTEPYSLFYKDEEDMQEYLGFVEDPETSLGSLYIAPIPYSSTDEKTKELFTLYSDLMEGRKDASFVMGYPVGADFTFDAIKAVGQESQDTISKGSKFTTFFAGVEQYYVFGTLIYLDCTAGVVGRTMSVAKNTKVNQLASARLYGAYPGTLYKTLKFSDVQKLHQEYNLNSVYSTPSGNYIWGIKCNYERKNSYFSKWNVVRVVNRLLKLTYPIVLNAIHTETVSDETTRLQFLSAIKDVLYSLAPANIKSESDVRMETDDVLTRGGEEIILYYDIWFKKLSEHCTITIAATDSSVNVTIQ